MSRDAERAVLGAVLARPTCIDEVRGIVSAEQFAHPENGAAFEAMCTLADRSERIDPVTIVAELERCNRPWTLDHVVELYNATWTAENVTTYARIVARAASVREVRKVAQEIAREAAGDHGDDEEFLDSVEARVMKTTSRRHATASKPLLHLAHAVTKRIEKRADGKCFGVKFGIKALDDLAQAVEPGNYALVAARPSHGKTALALKLCLTAAEMGVPSWFGSCEMPALDITERLIAMIGKVDSSRMRSGVGMRPQDWTAVTKAAGAVHQMPVHVEDLSAPTILELRGKAFAWAAKQPQRPPEDTRPRGVIVVDYVQLVKGIPGRKGEYSREREMSDVSQGLKSLAKDLAMPVVGLVQLSRAVEKREDRIPRLSDLRESGSFEQDGDVIIFVHREEMYDRRTDDKGIAELIVGKNRNGPTGTARARYTAECMLFDNLPLGGM